MSASQGERSEMRQEAPDLRENVGHGLSEADHQTQPPSIISGARSLSPSVSPRVDTRERTLVGDSPALTGIRDIADSIAPRRCTVLLLGETGTGKEMLARFIHERSDRREKPFIVVDCSAMTESLFESQLFGHTKGAFTGAMRESLGFIRAADGGTLFLDEVGELPLALQSKILRVIQEKAVVPVGDTHPKHVDIRIVCATHRDLRKMVTDGMFREDLFFRVNVVTLHLPPLRERTSDILELADHFLHIQAELYDEEVRAMSPDCMSVLKKYPWPGNVRELANAIEHAHVLCTGGLIQPENLPERVRAGTPDTTTQSELCLTDLERRAIVEALRRSKFNKASAAKMLGINIQKLNRRIEKLKVKMPYE